MKKTKQRNMRIKKKKTILKFIITVDQKKKKRKRMKVTRKTTESKTANIGKKNERKNNGRIFERSWNKNKKIRKEKNNKNICSTDISPVILQATIFICAWTKIRLHFSIFDQQAKIWKEKLIDMSINTRKNIGMSVLLR